MVSVKFAVIAFKKGETKFSINWPDTTELYLSQLQGLLSEAENYHASESRFHQVDSKIVANFVESAELAIAGAHPIHENAAQRIYHLLRGMDDHWGWTNCPESTLANYLTLANFEIIHRALYPFGYKILYDEFFPKHYESWYQGGFMVDQGDLMVNRMSAIFGFQEPVYKARVYEIGDTLIMSEYFWGPKSIILDAYRDPRQGPWLVDYLIPQNELLLAVSGSTETVIYNDIARISEVRTDTGDRLYLPPTKP